MQIVAVNSGNFNTKVKSIVGETLFPTRITENEDAIRYITDKNTILSVGEGYPDIDQLKSESMVHRLCTLYSIATMSNLSDLIIVTCLPVNQFKNHTIREKYKQSLIGQYNIETNKGTRNFKIHDNLVYMEGAAPVLAYGNLFKNRLINVVDIGGYNINVGQFQNGSLVRGTEDDYDMGMYKVKADIISELNKTQNMHIKEHELIEILKSPTTEQHQIINTHITKFISELRFNLKKKGYNLELNEFLFTGGGSVELEEYIKLHFQKAHIGTIFDTVRGLYEVGVRKCNFV